MKKLILLSAFAFTLSVQAQESKTWRWGIQWGFQGNKSDFSGGMTDANARFHENKNNDGALDLIFRYDHDKHWMATFGMGINTYGFNFGLSNNYSFLNQDGRWSGLNVSFTEFTTPILIHYKFDQNCKNARWFVGGGFVPTINSSKTINKIDVKNNDGVATTQNLSVSASNNNGASTMVRFVFGREKVFTRGSILHASWIFNVGLNDKAKATVNYTIDNTAYQHEFTNRGNFVGFRLAYFFKPLFNHNQTPAKKYGNAMSSTASTN